MALLLPLLSGLLFGLGLVVSGMADPAKVLNFLDVAGTWDPSLAFVMGGAVIVATIGFRLALRQPHPWVAPPFPYAHGAADRCPRHCRSGHLRHRLGPVRHLPRPRAHQSHTGGAGVLVFVPAMFAGMALARWLPGGAIPPRPRAPMP